MRRFSSVLIIAIILPFFKPINANYTEKIAISSTAFLWATPLNVTERQTELHIDTVNMYSDMVTIQDALDEVDDVEGDYPIYVLVFADEEERAWWGGDDYWAEYAISIIEQADEALVANFGIDIRILATISFDNLWKTEDDLKTMYDIWFDLESETYIFLGCHYDGIYWQDYVDAIIGITAHMTNDNIVGLAPRDIFLDQGRTYILVKWQAWWADDNVVQHEVSHLFYVYDHYDNTYCIMSYQHCYKVNTYCTECSNVITLYRGLYENSAHKLVVRYADIYNHPKNVSISHIGVYTYNSPTSVTVTASEGFLYWLVDGVTKIYENPITIQINRKRTLAANFTGQPAPPSPLPPPPSNGSGEVEGGGQSWRKSFITY